MKKIIFVSLLLFAFVGFTACDHDHDHDYRYSYNDLGDLLVGRVWSGNLGFFQNNVDPLVSHVYFGRDGFGTDELCYLNGSSCLRPLNIQWDVDDYYNLTLYINYGMEDYPRQLRDIHVYDNREIRGQLFIGEVYSGITSLYME